VLGIVPVDARSVHWPAGARASVGRLTISRPARII
jgi:hypothetical protein